PVPLHEGERHHALQQHDGRDYDDERTGIKPLGGKLARGPQCARPRHPRPALLAEELAPVVRVASEHAPYQPHRPPSVGVQYIALASDCLQINWICRIRLDLAAQTIDLHIDRALTARGVVAGELVAGDRRARPLREEPQEIALPLREFDGLVLALELPARDVKRVIAHPDLVPRARRTLSALEDIVQPQQQLARLERLDHVVVGAGLQALDALLRLGLRGKQADRNGGYGLEVSGELQAALTGHHDVQNDHVEG